MNRGSEWRRWEPHIHAPGTVMNNQFSGPTAWHDYLTALEQATPAIEAIAVTDYYVTDTYEEVLRNKAAGRLPAAKPCEWALPYWSLPRDPLAHALIHC